MEIEPVPHRSVRGERRRLAVGLLVLAPVVLLVLLPTVLGLDRYVVTDRGMEGSLGRGSVVLAREVPPTDLQVGDVITFRPSGSESDAQSEDQSDNRVTRRIVAIEDGVATTRVDDGTADPLTVPLTGSYARVWLSVPWIGYPFVVDGGWLLLALAAAGAGALAVAAGRQAPHRVVRTTRGGAPRQLTRGPARSRFGALRHTP